MAHWTRPYTSAAVAWRGGRAASAQPSMAFYHYPNLTLYYFGFAFAAPSPYEWTWFGLCVPRRAHSLPYGGCARMLVTKRQAGVKTCVARIPNAFLQLLAIAAHARAVFDIFFRPPHPLPRRSPTCLCLPLHYCGHCGCIYREGALPPTHLILPATPRLFTGNSCPRFIPFLPRTGEQQHELYFILCHAPPFCAVFFAACAYPTTLLELTPPPSCHHPHPSRHFFCPLPPPTPTPFPFCLLSFSYLGVCCCCDFGERTGWTRQDRDRTGQD